MFLILPYTVLNPLLEFTNTKSHYIFYGKYYDEVSIGSPVGPVLARIFMC